MLLADYPYDGSHAALLQWHIDRGTRPSDSKGVPGTPWRLDDLGSRRNVQNWLKKGTLPGDFQELLKRLFGNDLTLSNLRLDMQAAYNKQKAPLLQFERMKPAAATISDVVNMMRATGTFADAAAAGISEAAILGLVESSFNRFSVYPSDVDKLISSVIEIFKSTNLSKKKNETRLGEAIKKALHDAAAGKPNPTDPIQILIDDIDREIALSKELPALKIKCQEEIIKISQIFMYNEKVVDGLIDIAKEEFGDNQIDISNYLISRAESMFSKWELSNNRIYVVSCIEVFEYLRSKWKKIDEDYYVSINHKLGLALRSLGEKDISAKNLENAKDILIEVASIRKDQQANEGWAQAQNDLGITFKMLAERKDTVKMLEMATISFERALSIRNKSYAKLRAATLNNYANVKKSLGIAKLEKEYVLQAIEILEETLKTRNKNVYNEDWIKTKSNIADAYNTLGWLTDNSSHSKHAIKYFDEIINEIDKDRYPSRWARLVNNKAAACYQVGVTEKIESYVNEAVSLFESALKIRVFENVPFLWAETSHNLGMCLLALSEIFAKKDGAMRSIDFFEDALRVRNQEDTPEDWAISNFLLARAYTFNWRLKYEPDMLTTAVNFITNAANIQTSYLDDILKLRDVLETERRSL